MTVRAPANQISTDEEMMEMARAIHEQFLQEEVAALREARSAQNLTVAQRELLDRELRAAEAFAMGTSVDGSGVMTDDDALVARMAQEAEDAAFAASIAQQDHAAALSSSRAVVNVDTIEDAASRETAQNILHQEAKQDRRKRIINNLTSLILGVGLVFSVYWFLRRRSFVGGGYGGGNPFGDLADWFGWEGNEYVDGEDVPWYPKITKNGLMLRVLNNLDETWQDTFYTVMDEWDNGNPDTVSFQIERINDPECQRKYGAMVVCNGNYGMVDWRGINELIMENGYIVASVAKLNEFYLGGKDTSLRQYVCCHEIGHGLGLAHTDESYHNADLGECMDYTVNPEANMHPGETNFEALDAMYGTANGNRHNRGLESYSPVIDYVEYSQSDVKWRFLRKTVFSEHYEADLADGLKIHRTLHLA